MAVTSDAADTPITPKRTAECRGWIENMEEGLVVWAEMHASA